jgi:hypothetical protein
MRSRLRVRGGGRALVMAMLAAGAAMAGCARTVTDGSVVDRHGTAEAELEFWDGLTTERVLTNNDALHGLLMIGGQPAGTYEERLEAARSRGWLEAAAAPAANASAPVGMVAVAVCEILEIRGGVTMHVFGPSARYCTRELVFRGLIPQRGEHQAMSGLEFIDLAGRIQDYRGDRATSGPGGVGGGGES